MIPVSLCFDRAKLREHVCIKCVDGELPIERILIENTGGAHRFENGNTSLTVLSGTAGLDHLFEEEYMVLTSLEAIFGEFVQTEIDGELQWNDEDKTDPTLELVPADEEMRAKYDQIYPRTPVPTEDGFYTPRLIFSKPAGADISRLNV